jgi:AraC-like DNA-binding protein
LFFDDAAAREDQWLGWHTSRYVGDHNLNASLLRKLENSPTLYQALLSFLKLIRSEASHIQMGIRKHPSGIIFFTHYPDLTEEPGYHISQGYQLGVVIDLARHYIGPDWQPKEIGVQASSIPRVINEQYPGSRIMINQPFGYFTIPFYCLQNALKHQHRDLAGKTDLANANHLSDAQTLSLLLAPYLSEGYPTMQFAASLLDYSKRTLARRLAACGTSYQKLIDETRFRKAETLLTVTDARIKDVARSVGFSDPAHFSRMFRRLGGIGPRHFRRMARNGSDTTF